MRKKEGGCVLAKGTAPIKYNKTRRGRTSKKPKGGGNVSTSKSLVTNETPLRSLLAKVIGGGLSLGGIGVGLDVALRNLWDKPIIQSSRERRKNPWSVFNIMHSGDTWKPRSFTPTGDDKTDRMLFQTGVYGGVGLGIGALAYGISRSLRDKHVDKATKEIDELIGEDAKISSPSLSMSSWALPKESSSQDSIRPGFLDRGLPGWARRNVGVPFATPTDADFWRLAGPVGAFGTSMILGAIIYKKHKEGKKEETSELSKEGDGALSWLRGIQGLIALAAFTGTAYPAYSYFKKTDKDAEGIKQLIDSLRKDVMDRDSAVSGLEGRLGEWRESLIPADLRKEEDKGVEEAAKPLDADEPVDTTAISVEEEEVKKDVDPDDPFADLLSKI